MLSSPYQFRMALSLVLSAFVSSSIVFQYRCAHQAMLRYSVRLHALCVGHSSIRVKLTSDLLFTNSGYTIRSFRSTWKRWRNTILLITTKTLSSGLVLPVSPRSPLNERAENWLSFFPVRQNLGHCFQYCPQGVICLVRLRLTDYGMNTPPHLYSSSLIYTFLGLFVIKYLYWRSNCGFI